MDLRDYQKSIVNSVLKAKGNVLLGLPTGAGKTVIASELIRRSSRKVVFLVPRIDLLQQAIDTFNVNGLKVAVVWKDIDEHTLTDVDVYVSVRQTMYRKSWFRDWVKDKVVIVDEAHIGLEAQHDYYLTAHRVIGLTATPEQMSKKSMLRTGEGPRFECAVYDDYFYPYQIKDLQQMGFLAEYQFDACKHITFPEEVIRRWKRLGKLEGDFDETENIIIQNLDVVANTISKSEDPTIVFTPTVNSAYAVLNTLDKSKWAVVTGSTPKDERDKLYQDVEDGKLIGLINCGVLTTGFDLPCIKRLILCRHILSKSLFVQIVGRALRPFEGKVAHIVDVMDSYSNFVDSISQDGTITWYPEGFDKVEGDPLDSIPEDKKEAYRKDPQGTLLKLMLDYQRAMEDMKEAVEAYESEIVIKPIPRTVVKEVVKEVVREVPVNNRVTPNEVTDFLLKDFFAASKYIIPGVLRKIDYDKDDASKVKLAISEIWNATFNISFEDMKKSDLDYTICYKRFLKMIDWWLQNFRLDYVKE